MIFPFFLVSSLFYGAGLQVFFVPARTLANCWFSRARVSERDVNKIRKEKERKRETVNEGAIDKNPKMNVNHVKNFYIV